MARRARTLCQDGNDSGKCRRRWSLLSARANQFAAAVCFAEIPASASEESPLLPGLLQGQILRLAVKGNRRRGAGGAMDGAGAAEPWEETCDIHDLLLWDPVCQPPLRAQCPPQRTTSPFATHVQASMGLVYAQNAPTASQLPDGRSLGRDSQPPSGTHVATTRRSPLQSSSPAPSASAKRQPNRSVLCKNRGCDGLAVGRAANRQRKCAPITRFRLPRMPLSKGVHAHALRLPCRAL